MWLTWKRITSGVLLLASLSLVLFGCSDYSGTPTSPSAPVTKSITGTVSDPATGVPLANATVTAYAVDATGVVQRGTPLSEPATSQSDGNGNYVLKIPADYTGQVIVEATGAAGQKIRAILPNISITQAVILRAMISYATEMLVQYIEINKGGTFSSDNIQKATVVMEEYLGLNFTQTPPPAGGFAATTAQQDLIVMIRALNALNVPIATLVTINPTTNMLGLGSFATQLTIVVTTVESLLIAAGTIPGTYTLDAAITAAITHAATTPVTEPTLSDSSPPSAPADLAWTATTSSVALSWTASTDTVGVTFYYVYRDGVYLAAVAGPAFTDKRVTAATTYSYEVKARDASGNISSGSTIAVTTATRIFSTYVISGTVSFNGVGLAGVTVAITGTGTGSVATDANGSYSVSGVRNGSYTITPLLGGYAFTPVNRQVAVSDANVTGLDFSAALDGSIIGGTTYPTGSVTGGLTYPNGSVTGGTTYPDGSVTGGTTYPNGTVTGGTTYPNGSVTGVTTYPSGSVTGGTTYPTGSITGTLDWTP